MTNPGTRLLPCPAGLRWNSVHHPLRRTINARSAQLTADLLKRVEASGSEYLSGSLGDITLTMPLGRLRIVGRVGVVLRHMLDQRATHKWLQVGLKRVRFHLG